MGIYAFAVTFAVENPEWLKIMLNMTTLVNEKTHCEGEYRDYNEMFNKKRL